MVAPGLVLGLVLPLILWADRSAGIGFRFASYINNDMVLQKEPAGAVIWGFGTPGATVTVTLRQGQETIMKKVTSVKAHSDTWMVVLDPMKPGGPFEVMAQQTLEKINFTLRVHDVLFGDVWLCSGQSNMQMTVLQIFNATRELSNTAAYQSVRILSVSPIQAEQELEDLVAVDLQWSKPTSGFFPRLPTNLPSCCGEMSLPSTSSVKISRPFGMGSASISRRCLHSKSSLLSSLVSVSVDNWSLFRANSDLGSPFSRAFFNPLGTVVFPSVHSA
ncbi:sialate O-acetylesterase isoform X2 [Homo sapiens]|uniref:sialate O-acetylesterase isoform X2 n=1 Tax=Homo sapiens TaxID=9606 RepID=UPI000387DEBB|nr:sialate O-acetylesterase isoform X2 [Homo sapiens]